MLKANSKFSKTACDILYIQVLLPSTFVWSKKFGFFFLEVGGLFSHLILNGILPGVVLGLAASLQIHIVNLPVL